MGIQENKMHFIKDVALKIIKNKDEQIYGYRYCVPTMDSVIWN